MLWICFLEQHRFPQRYGPGARLLVGAARSSTLEGLLQGRGSWEVLTCSPLERVETRWWLRKVTIGASIITSIVVPDSHVMVPDF